MKKEHSDIRFGTAAIQKGFVTPEQVIDALAIQAKEDFSIGIERHRPIGRVLLDQRIINKFQLNEILQTQKEMRHRSS